MTNKEKLQKLKLAQELIREVEFSLPQGSEDRQMLYRFIVNNFSLVGDMVAYMHRLTVEIETDKRSMIGKRFLFAGPGPSSVIGKFCVVTAAYDNDRYEVEFEGDKPNTMMALRSELYTV